jgi:nicotinamidase-related amidase
MSNNTYSEKQLLQLAKKDYEQGDAKFDIVTEKTALLVIDMQDEFVKPHWTPFWVPEATKQVPKIKRLIDHCRTKHIPVIFTVYSNTHNFLDRPKTLNLLPKRNLDLDIDYSSFFIHGTVWHEIAPIKDEIVIHKSSYGAFFDTPLETILKNLGKDTVIICGTMTNYCCGTTARQAYERGFKVAFGSDINATDDQTIQQSELKTLRRGFAKILSVEDIIKQLK